MNSRGWLQSYSSTAQKAVKNTYCLFSAKEEDLSPTSHIVKKKKIVLISLKKTFSNWYFGEEIWNKNKTFNFI